MIVWLTVNDDSSFGEFEALQVRKAENRKEAVTVRLVVRGESAEFQWLLEPLHALFHF